MPATKPNSKKVHLLSSVMLLSAACTYGVSADTPSTLLITAVGLAVSFFLPRPFDRSSRTYIYGSVLVMTTVALEMQMLPVEPGRFFLLPAEVYCPLLLYLGVAATYVEDREPNLCAIIAFSLLAMMLAGNTLTPERTNERLPFSDAALQNFHFFFGIALAIQTAAMVGLLHGITPKSSADHTVRGRRLWFRTAILATCLLLAGLSVVGLRRTVFAYEMLLNRWFNELFQLYIHRRIRRVVFDSEVDLWRTVPHRTAQDSTVVIRAQSETPPGYLRGRVYLAYSDGRWSGRAPGGNLSAKQPGGKRVYTIFDRPLSVSTDDPPTSTQANTIDIYAHRLYTDVLLAPGTANRFELIAEQLRSDGNGVLEPDTWKQEAGYRLHTAASRFPDAYPLPRLASPAPQEFLQIPDALRKSLTRIADEACGGSDQPLKPHIALSKITSFLNKTCTYELGVRMNGGEDPVLQFLETNHRGHCELFATSAVLLLRTKGIPARYVTGFVCAEKNPVGKHWISRLRDAHAWAEAYIPTLDQWVLVEATPGDGVPDGDEAASTAASWWDTVRLFFQTILSKMKRGDVAEGIGGVVAMLGRLIGAFLCSPLGIAAVVLASLWTGRAMRRQHLRRSQQDALFPDTVRELRRQFVKIERFLKSKGIERSPHTTPRELALRLAESAPAAWCDPMARVLDEYERLRYSLPAPSPAAVAEFSSRVKAACASS